MPKTEQIETTENASVGDVGDILAERRAFTEANRDHYGTLLSKSITGPISRTERDDLANLITELRLSDEQVESDKRIILDHQQSVADQKRLASIRADQSKAEREAESYDRESDRILAERRQGGTQRRWRVTELSAQSMALGDPDRRRRQLETAHPHLFRSA